MSLALALSAPVSHAGPPRPVKVPELPVSLNQDG